MSLKSLVAILIIGILAIAIPVSVRLAQQQTQLKSKANECTPNDKTGTIQRCQAGTTQKCTYNQWLGTDCNTGEGGPYACVNSTECGYTEPSSGTQCTPNDKTGTIQRCQAGTTQKCTYNQWLGTDCNTGEGGPYACVNSTECGYKPPSGGTCPAGSTYTVSGTVKDQNGAALSGVSVCLDPPPAGCAGTTFSSNASSGSFSIANVVPGGLGHNVYLDLGSQSGKYQVSSQNPVSIAGSVCTNPSPIAFTIAPVSCQAGTKYKITGKVSSSGGAISGAKLCLDPTVEGSCSGKAASEVFATDSSGNYAITNVIPGGEGHNVYLDPTSLPTGVTAPPVSSNPKLVLGTVCSDTVVDFTGSEGGGITSTKCYVLSENSSDVTSVKKCDFRNPLVHRYSENPLTYPFKDKSPGERTIYVKFFDQNEKASNDGTPFSKKIVLSPNPTITNLSCNFASSGVGTQINITGTNFGAKGAGSLKVGDKAVQTSSWGPTSIIASVDQRLENSATVTVTLDDGRTVSEACNVNTTTFTFTAKNQCRRDGKFNASEVDVKVYDVGLEPVISQLISLDTNGKPQGFAPKLEKNKNYTVLVKEPGTLAKKLLFSTGTGGSVVIPPFTVLLGDIAPLNNPDGFVNNFDAQELKREWRLFAGSTNQPGDFNGDGAVNSIDYSCLRLGVGKEDDKFSPVTTSPGSNDVGTTNSSGVGSSAP